MICEVCAKALDFFFKKYLSSKSLSAWLKTRKTTAKEIIKKDFLPFWINRQFFFSAKKNQQDNERLLLAAHIESLNSKQPLMEFIILSITTIIQNIVSLLLSVLFLNTLIEGFLDNSLEPTTFLIAFIVISIVTRLFFNFTDKIVSNSLYKKRNRWIEKNYPDEYEKIKKANNGKI